MESGVNYYRNIFTDRPPELLAAIMKPLQVREGIAPAFVRLSG
jgi:hypothetical protein